MDVRSTFSLAVKRPFPVAFSWLPLRRIKTSSRPIIPEVNNRLNNRLVIDQHWSVDGSPLGFIRSLSGHHIHVHPTSNRQRHDFVQKIDGIDRCWLADWCIHIICLLWALSGRHHFHTIPISNALFRGKSIKSIDSGCPIDISHLHWNAPSSSHSHNVHFERWRLHQVQYDQKLIIDQPFSKQSIRIDLFLVFH